MSKGKGKGKGKGKPQEPNLEQLRAKHQAPLEEAALSAAAGLMMLADGGFSLMRTRRATDAPMDQPGYSMLLLSAFVYHTDANDAEVEALRHQLMAHIQLFNRRAQGIGEDG